MQPAAVHQDCKLHYRLVPSASLCNSALSALLQTITINVARNYYIITRIRTNSCERAQTTRPHAGGIGDSDQTGRVRQNKYPEL